MDNSHGVDNLFFDFFIADNWVGIKEMARHSYQSVFGPSAEPIHCATRY